MQINYQTRWDMNNKARACIVATFFMALSLCGCRGESQYAGNGMNSDFSQLYDSIATLSRSDSFAYDRLMSKATDSMYYYSVFIIKGTAYFNSRTPDSTLYYATRTLNFAERQENSPRKMTLLALSKASEAAYFHLNRKYPEETINLYQEAYRNIMLSDYQKHAPNIAANMADAYILNNNMTEAAKWYRKAIFLVDSLKLPKQSSVTLYLGLAQIYTKLEDYDAATELYKQAKARYNELTPSMQTYLLINCCNNQYYSRQYNEALYTLRQLQDHLKQIGSNNDMASSTCEINLADVFLNLNMIDSAEAYVDKPARFFDENGINLGTYYANTIRIGIAMKRHDYNRVEQILNNERNLGVNDQSMINIRRRYLANYYELIGDYKRAYENERTKNMANDSIYHERGNMKAAEIMARLTEDTLRLHHLLEMKQQEDELSSFRVSLILAISSVVMVLTFLAMYIMYSKKQRQQTDIDIFKLKLANIRQRISPHFVFNVLNAKIVNAPKAESDILIDMAKLIRQSLDLSQHTYISLYDELRFVKRYIGLQRTLLGEDIEVIIDTPDEDTLEEILIPSMFVQILVENAIKHGLKCVEGHKKLTLKVSVDDSVTVITVADNGPGFDITRNNQNSTRIGLNVITRTISALNRRSKKSERMAFALENINNSDGSIAGCRATLTIPRSMKLTTAKQSTTKNIYS